MSERVKGCVLSNMVMLRRVDGRVLAQRRIKPGWSGITFPGGHIEAGESLVDSAKREVQEETGFTVDALRMCGAADWCNEVTGERYLVFLFVADSFHGELCAEQEEGELFWVTVEELWKLPLSLNFDCMLRVFLEDNASEAYGAWLPDFSAPMRVL